MKKGPTKPGASLSPASLGARNRPACTRALAEGRGPNGLLMGRGSGLSGLLKVCDAAQGGGGEEGQIEKRP